MAADSLIWILFFLLVAGASVFALISHRSHHTSSPKELEDTSKPKPKSKKSKGKAKENQKSGNNEKPAPKKEQPKKEQPKKEQPKKEQPKKKEQKKEQQKKEQPKKQQQQQPKKEQKQNKADQKGEKKSEPKVKKRALPGAKGIVRAGGGSAAFKDANFEFDLPFDSEEPTKKALQFGLLYRDTDYQLEGCVNDINNVKNDLLKKIGFDEKHIIQITDDTKIKPTKENMKRAMLQFAEKAIDGDILFFQYSGHGTEVKDKSGDEKDGFDEALCPLDGGTIIDDWIFANVVQVLEKKPKARFFALYDCCHSGTCMDLPFQYAAFRGDKPCVKQLGEGKKSKNRKAKAHVVGFSAALDNQQAVDMQEGIPQGAFTNAFLQVLKKHIAKRKTYRQFLLEVDGLLAKQGFAHQASLSCAFPIDLDSELHLW